MKGKIKLISIKNTDFKKGSQVIWEKAFGLQNDGCIRTVRKKDHAVDMWWVERKDSIIPLCVNYNELKTLVVEYPDRIPGKSTKIPTPPRYMPVQIPLNYSDWQKAIDSGVVNTETEIDFKTEKIYIEPDDSIHCNRGVDIDIAKIIKMPKKIDSLALALNTPDKAKEFMNSLNNLKNSLRPVKGINWEDIKKQLYESVLSSSEQTDDAKGEEDYGAYWLTDVTVEEVVEWFKTAINKK